jgi:hypothetical protein
MNKKSILVYIAFILFAAGCGGPAPSLNSADPDLRRIEVINLSDSSNAAVHYNTFATILEKDPDYLVRAQAALALGKLKNPQAIPLLIKALEDTSQWVRLDAVTALSHTNDASAILPLCKVLKDDVSPDVRRSSARLLGEIGGEIAVPALIQSLDDKDQAVTEISYKALQKITGQKALPKDGKAWQKWQSEKK